ncbi:MAG: hypothetical protein HQL28_06820, partial [Candidatus Omnitrophica bacterium]|nr:hypothetical protein [Candidatus Omnitrophota bacterium]
MFNFIKNSSVTKIVSVFLVMTFLSYNTLFASPTQALQAPKTQGNVSQINPPVDIKEKPVSVNDVGIGIDTGTIKSQFRGSSDKFIIHIQDAHCNYEAQTNIDKILEQLFNENGLGMISVEGAEGIVDTSWFKAFPDAEIRKEVANYFMKKGEITGAEYFSITSEYNGVIFGAENREDYIKNLKAFTETYPYKTVIENYFQDLKTIANRLKSLMYNPALKELDQKIRMFDEKDKTMELSAFAAYLNGIFTKEKISLNTYPNFKKLVDTLDYEKKINFDIVDQERAQYIDMLSKKLDKDAMAELVTLSIKFKKGHIKPVEFYTYLREKADALKIPIVHDYKNLFYYYIYTKLYDGIDNEGLFKELDVIKRLLKAKYFTSDDEKTLDKYSEMVVMYANLVNIELTNDDYDVFKKYYNEFNIETMVEFFAKQSQKYNLSYAIEAVPEPISKNIPNMISFYEIAMKRDKELLDNTLGQMDKLGKKFTVLITGGFHTKGMKNMLEKQGISYMVVMPKITKDVETPYLKVLTNQRTSLEDIITERSVTGAGANPADNKGKNAQSVPEMLAPVLRMAYSQMLFTKGGADELKKIAQELGFTGQKQDLYGDMAAFLSEYADQNTAAWFSVLRLRLAAKLEDTKGQLTTEQYDQEMQSLFAAIQNGKLSEWQPSEFIRTNLSKKWNEYLSPAGKENWLELKRVYLGKFTGENRISSGKTLEMVEADVDAYYALNAPKTAAGELKPTGGAQGATGAQSLDAAHKADKVIAESIAKMKAEGIFRQGEGGAIVPMDNISTGLVFVKHKGFIEKLGGLNPIHPGRGGDKEPGIIVQRQGDLVATTIVQGSRKLLQIHIDWDLYEALKAADLAEEQAGLQERTNYLATVAEHEWKHLALANTYDMF